MTALPPKPGLEALLADLARHLPESHATLLAAPELERGRAALAVLAEPDRRAHVVQALDAAEAEWLAEVIEARWARLGTMRREPAAAILCVEEAWLAGGRTVLRLGLAVEGLASGWKARWPEGAVAEGEGATLAVSGAAPGPFPLQVKIIGRRADGDGRAVLAARRTVRLRRPVLRLDLARAVLSVTDQDGAPAAGLTLEVAGTPQSVPRDGLLRLDPQLEPGAEIRLDGTPLAVGLG